MEQVIYDSDAYHVVHKKVADHDIFEIVERLRNREAVLTMWLATMFAEHIYAWQDNTPTPEQVEWVLGGFIQLASIPRIYH